MERLYVALAALLGGIISSLLGWLDSQAPFDNRKFAASVIRSLIAGIIFAVGFEVQNGISILDLFYALLGGAGVDVLGNRVSSRFGKGKFPLR